MNLFKKIYDDELFFEKWFQRYHNSDNFLEYVWPDYEFDYGNLVEDNINITQKYIEDWKLKKTKKKSEIWFNQQLDYLINLFDNVSNNFDSKVNVYRKVTIRNEQLDEFIKKTKEGSHLDGYNGLGVCWSWDSSKANAHWGEFDNSSQVLIQGLVDFKDCDIEESLLLNFCPVLGSDESEIRLSEGVNIFIRNIIIEDDLVIEINKEIRS